MNLVLRRTSYTSDGIFGNAFDEMNDIAFVTLEHACNLTPKIPPGIYTCLRGMHRLNGMSEPFQTFEVTEVPGHTGILFHAGNSNADSSGCILVGTAIVGNLITDSRVAFKKFMTMQMGVDEFQLLVKA